MDKIFSWKHGVYDSKYNKYNYLVPTFDSLQFKEWEYLNYNTKIYIKENFKNLNYDNFSYTVVVKF